MFTFAFPGFGRLTAMSVELIAHRGWSGRYPEMTRAAYTEAIGLAERSGRLLALECDAQFSADRQLVLMHDFTLWRTGARFVTPGELTMDELRTIDVGSWKLDDPAPDERTLLTLPQLCDLVAEARDRGVPVELAIETKHPNPAGLDVDRACLELVDSYGWLGDDSPVRMISFNPAAVALHTQLAPQLRRSLLLEKRLGEWADGHLPDGVDTIGVSVALADAHPEWVDRLLGRGHHLHLWTVNDPQRMAAWIDRGATGITTDLPDVAIVHGI